VIRVELETRIGRPPDEVFAYLADPANLHDWQGTAEVEQLTPGPIAAGTRFRELHRMLGRRIESVTEIVDYQPDRRFAIRVISGPLPIDGRWDLEPDGTGTLLRFSAEGVGPALAAPLARHRFRNQHARLKAAFESRSRK
jgi:uncharacterized protein YndB with AHSA1/START domain